MRRAGRLTIGGGLTALATSLLTAAPALAASKPAGGAATGEIIEATGFAMVMTTALLVLGFGHRSGRVKLLGRAANWASRISGLPPWVALPSGISTASLLTALMGMYWDISLHIDQGRDPGPLANPAHYLILLGLFGIFSAGFLSMCLPEGKPSPTAVRIHAGWHAPLGAVLITACGAFALIGFPLDDGWHRLFGQDVTLWGPTHLMLIGGASLSLLGQAVLLAEGTRARGAPSGPQAAPQRPGWELALRRAGVAGGFLIGLSTFQAEFDFGVPQFDFLFQPMLIALAAGVGLVSARIWNGRGGALSAVAFFLVVRGLISLIVGGAFGETTPHLPLYIVEALLVEGVALWLTTRRPLLLGAVAGALIGTVGLAAEYAWSHVWAVLPWPGSLFPAAIVVALLAGVAGGVLGALIGCALRARPLSLPGGARVALAAAALVVVGLLAYGLHTDAGSRVSATVALRDVPSHSGRKVAATVAFHPANAADDLHWLTATSWQGGGLVVDRLVRVREGVYRSTQALPVNGDWKTLIRFHSGRSLQGLPIYLPADRAIPVPGVAATPRFTRTFVKDRKILQRESKNKSGIVPLLAYAIVLAITLALLGMLAWALARLARAGEEPPSGRRGAPESSRGARAVTA